MLTGNSLAYLLCQEQKYATADVRVVSRARTQMRESGNSLAYLLCQEQKRATADVRVVSLRPISKAWRTQASQAAA
jgi:hypothetical protein